MNDRVDWKKLNKRLRSHKSKLIQGWFIVLLYKEVIKSPQEFSFDNLDEIISSSHILKDPITYMVDLITEENLEEVAVMQMLLYDYKNGSLYAEYIDGEFKKSSEAIDKEICILGITMAIIQKHFIELLKNEDGFIRVTMQESDYLSLKKLEETIKGLVI